MKTIQSKLTLVKLVLWMAAETIHKVRQRKVQEIINQK